MQLQASDRGTKGLGKLVGEGQPWWESDVAGKLATPSHAPPTSSHAPVHGGSLRLKNTHVSARGSLFHAEVSFDR